MPGRWPPCQSRLLLLLLLCTALVADAGLFGGSSVVTLTGAGFDAHLRDNRLTMVEFFAPWCGHCKKLEAEYEEAAAALKAKGVVLAKIDGTSAQEVASRYSVENYPTLLWFERGVKAAYDGDQPPTKDSIVEWVTTAISPAVMETSSPPEPGKLPRMVLYAESLLEGFESAAKANRKKASWYFVKDSSGSPKIVLQHKGEEPSELTNYLADQDVIQEFLDKRAAPLFGPLTGDTYQIYENQALIWSLFPVSGKSAMPMTELEPMMTQVAKRFVGKYSVTYTDTAKFKDNIENMLGISDYPAIVVQPQAGSKLKYAYHGQMSADAIIRFVDDVAAGNVDATYKSEPVPTTNSGPVRVVVASNMREEVFQADKDVIIKFYAPWCGSCKKLEPEYNKLASYVRKEQLEEFVAVAKIDATANDIPISSMEYTSFPTLYFVKAGSETPEKYEGERTAKGMWKWIKQRASRQAEIRDQLAKTKAAKSAQEL